MKEKQIKEIWHYKGRFALTGNKQGVHYLDPNGREMVFSKKKSTTPSIAVVGNAYEVTVTRYEDEGDTLTMHGTPSLVDMNEHPKHEEAGEWRAQETEYLEGVKMVNLAKKSKDDTRFDECLDYLCKRYRGASYSTRAALLGYIIKRITG